MEDVKNKKPKIYVGSARSFEYGVNISVCLSDIPSEWIQENEKTGKTWVNLTLRQLRNPLEGRTHSVEIDQYIPKSKREE